MLLEGLRILEVSSFVAAPLAGLTLAQLGAEVIRVDPVGGSPDRTRWPLAPDGPSLYWAGLNRGKTSIEIDLASDGGRALVHRLLADAEGGILVTNAAGRGWLADAALREVRPDLIHVQITGTHDGRTAVDYTVNAAVGFPAVTGAEGGDDPVNHVLPAWDVACGLYAATAILAAERRRSRTGEGAHLTIALEDVALASASNLGLLAEAQLTGRGRPRIGNHLYGGLARDFATADGGRLMIVTLTPRHWDDLVALTGIGGLVRGIESAHGVDLRRDADRYAHRLAIAEAIEPWFAARTLGEAEAALAATSIVWSRYRSFLDLATAPDGIGAHPLFSVVDDPGIGRVHAAGSPITEVGCARPAVRPAPRPGSGVAPA